MTSLIHAVTYPSQQHILTYDRLLLMGQVRYGKDQQSGDRRYRVDPQVAMRPIDALGFRRGAGALKTLLHDTGLEDHPLFAQAKGRGIRALMGHAESTDVTNDVNGGPSGIGIATAAGKAAFWDIAGAPDSPKVIALEGEFALTEGHAQELKTQALALQVGKRLRVMISDNNAGIDDRLIGVVIGAQFDSYDLVNQWASYGWNVFTLANGNDYGQVAAVLKAMDAVDSHDRRPIAAIGKTIKGYWPAAVDGKVPGYGDQLVSYPSHPYALKMNSEYFVALAQTFEKQYGVEFEGIRKGAVSNNRERLIQFKTNIDVVMSLLDRNGLGDRLADRLLEIGDGVRDDVKLRISASSDPFLGDRLRVTALPEEPQKRRFTMRFRCGKRVSIALFETGRGGRGAARNFRNHQVDELRR
jgi:transketolase N-terminal domain/subunit